ncbi:N-acetylglucosamine kinase [Sporosarcina sp. OR05]|uniref:N-acetylglucosamine kinase n=1 Tax=Sporosarcina sp. OR05 TaxID=2969819 RepID=UPI00352A78F7
MYVLGIDGGGTRTTAVVADEFGNVYMHAVAGRSNPNTLTQEAFEEVLSSLLVDIKKQNDDVFRQLSLCYAGIAGVGESGRDEEVVTLLRKGLPPQTVVTVQNDAWNALYAGTLGKPGIVQIAGTGAITLGVNEEGKEARVGGWGYLFDDEGSGFYLGKHALKAIFRAYDGRGPETSLSNRFCKHFQIAHVPTIISKVYGNEHPRSVIAPLAHIVVEEAQQGDAVALAITNEACKEMVHAIHTCHRTLFANNHATNIVLSGGVFSEGPFFIEKFRALSKVSLPSVTFELTKVPPVGGAVLAAFASEGIQVAEDFSARFNEKL